MYKSPIDMLISDIQHQIVQQEDEHIYQAVLHCIPNVDREELLRALKYDRDQYNKGHLDGYTEAMSSIVRCKDCKHFYTDEYYGATTCDHDCIVEPDNNDFCSYGERREGE